MKLSQHLRSGSRWIAATIAAASLASFAAQPLLSQQQAPDLARMEADYEKALASVLAMGDDDPFAAMQAWSGVLMTANMIERVRAQQSGLVAPPAVDADAVLEGVLARWQRERPESGGPDLFRTFSIRDAAEKRAAVLALLDRYPDDGLVLWQATMQLRQQGELERAEHAVEAFLGRHPDRVLGYELLVANAMNNETRLAEALGRWERYAPGDARLVGRWMATSQPRRDPAATARVLDAFFARRPHGEADVAACIAVAQAPDGGFAASALECLARTAGDADESRPTVDRATQALARIAAKGGDWAAFEAALARLDAPARSAALIQAARQQTAPDGCAIAIRLLEMAAAGGVAGDSRSIASALHECASRPEARALFLSLLATAAADDVPQIVGAWLTRVNDRLEGTVPAGTDASLERRLQSEPSAVGLYRALANVYEWRDPDDRRFDLLRRWQTAVPDAFSGEAATDLAMGLLERQRPRDAIAVLERQLETRLEPQVVELLWRLYWEIDGPGRAEQLADELLAAADDWRRQEGHLLAARSALRRGDTATAESHYWEALGELAPRQQVAVELLAVTAVTGDAARLEQAARRLCEQKKFAELPPQTAACAAELLHRAGQGEAAARFVSAQARDLPSDPEALRRLAASAEQAGELDAAERARRRILEVDPESEASWEGLGVFLEKQGRAQEVEALLAASYRQFTTPPTFLARAAGRALTAAGEPRRAIGVLLEARASLPDDKGGEWSRSWIDRDLRQAYARLGEKEAPFRSAAARAAAPTLRTAQPAEVPSAGTADELRRAADALVAGDGGRFDPVAAIELYGRAAAKGDAAATFRLALLRLVPVTAEAPDPKAAGDLARRAAPAVTERAQQGDAYAQFLIGTAELVGLGRATDAARARRWFEASARQGDSRSWRNLGWMQERGEGFEVADAAAALVSYRHAAEAGNVRGMVDFARLALQPEASGPVCAEGMTWLRKAAAAAHARAALLLGKLLFYGAGECVARDVAEARSWLMAAAEVGQPGAAFDLALAFALGSDPADRKQGLAQLETIAATPDVLAVETLELFVASGLAGPRDVARAHRLSLEAARLGADGFPHLAEHARRSVVFRDLLDGVGHRLEALAGDGDAAAAARFARMLELGLVSRGERGQIVPLARQGAAGGEALAMRVLADAFRSGLGVERDLEESRRWRRRCAEAGDAFCMMFLGNALLEGEEEERDVSAGLAWLRRAGETGNWWAVGDLGNLYDEGWQGIPRDAAEAARWKRRRAELGDPAAAGWLLYHDAGRD